MKRNLSVACVLLLIVVFFVGCSDTALQNDGSSPISDSDILDEVQQESEEMQHDDSSDEQEIARSASYEITNTRVKTWTNNIGSTWVQTIVEITNNGTANLYLSSSSYDLEDASGNLVSSNKYVSVFPNVLAPGEKGYMYEETTLDESVEGELTVLPHLSIEEATVDLIRLPITDVELSEDTYNRVKMIGRVENTSDEVQSFVYVVAFLYNSEGECIGQLLTTLTDDLAVGDKIGFEMTEFSLPDDITTDIIADYVIYAYPSQYQF